VTVAYKVRLYCKSNDQAQRSNERTIRRALVQALDEEVVGVAPIAVLPVSATEGIGMDAL